MGDFNRGADNSSYTDGCVYCVNPSTAAMGETMTGSQSCEHSEAMEMLARVFAGAYRIDDLEDGDEYVEAVMDICRQNGSEFDMQTVNICKKAGFVDSGVQVTGGCSDGN